MTPAVAVLGGGRIGEALLAGLLASGHAAEQVVVVERYPERSKELADRYGVLCVDVAAAATFARTLIIAVKPADVDALLASLAPAVGVDHLVVSVAAGITTARLEAGLPAEVPVVRCMPNTPALVGEAMTAIAAGTHAGDDHLSLAESLLSAVGRVARVPEAQLDAVTALSGSGPAYVFLLVEAMVDAGVLLGLSRPLATELAVQTALGSAKLLRESSESPAQLREAVSSPAGTTVAALRVFESQGLRGTVLAAVEAAAARSAELGRG